MIETDEWQHSCSEFCFLSIIGAVLPTFASAKTKPEDKMVHGDSPRTPIRSGDIPTNHPSPILSSFDRSSGKFSR